MSTDAIVVLKQDHATIRKLFRDYQAAGKNATATKGRLAKRIIEELTVHTYLENEVMYPEVRALMPDWRTTSWRPTRNTTWPTSW